MTNLLSDLPKQLQKSIEDILSGGHLPHAIILESKNEQITKKLTMILSQTAVCLSENASPCGECRGCMKVVKGVHPDVFFLKGSTASGNVSIDDIRNLCRDTYTIPNEALSKVYILPDCQKYSQQVQNALLKSLEEPQQSTLYILQCTSSDTLLGTVKSRCVTLRAESDDNKLLTDVQSNARNTALEIASACTARDMEFRLMCMCERLSAQKDTLELVFIELKRIFTASFNSAFAIDDEQEVAKKINKYIDPKCLIKMVDVAEKARSSARLNMNTVLFLSWFCAALKEAKSSEVL